MTTPITVEQVKRFAAAWYQALDRHAPVEELYSLLADEGLRMHFPEGDIRDVDGFRRWYERVIHRFFDENHTVHGLEAHVQEEVAEVRVVVGWQASWFDPPAAKSQRLSLDATQMWSVRRSDKNAYGLELITYDATAEPFQYAPGFARL